ncbi:MAG: DUF5995 family protein [Propionibacteriaceae bacterium]
MTDAVEQITSVVDQLQRRIEQLPSGMAHRRAFLGTYQRTTAAIAAAVADGLFEDPDWVGHWDVVFAGHFLAAHDADLSGAPVPEPWRLAFAAPAELSDLIHLLLGLNAHINYDLPQAIMAVISGPEFADPDLMARRRRDHERIDQVISSRVAAEGPHQEKAPSAAARARDWLLTPLNRWSSRRFLRLARRDVWHNVMELDVARQHGPADYASRLTELEDLAAAKISVLLRRGPVLLRLAVVGFGVRFPKRD